MNSKKFFHETFCRGTRDDVRVVPHDYPCEQSHIEYLAAATAGAEVAVGYLFVHELRGDDSGPGYEVYSVRGTPLVIVPDVGIWICQPAFAPLRQAFDSAAEDRARVAGLLGREPGDVPIELAIIAVTESLPSLVGIDPRYLYDAALYDDPATSLSARRPRDWPADEVNRTIGELLELGGWGDAKKGSTKIRFPHWLAQRLGFAEDAA